MRKRIALGVSIPAVILFVGFLFALLVPSNLLTLTEALDNLGLLGGRLRIARLVVEPTGPSGSSGASSSPPPLAFLGGRLWDAAHGSRDNPGLFVTGGRIADADVPPTDARVIDATGLTILPGLIDMHIHSFGGSFDGELMIGNGVTTARDLGTQLAGAIRHRREAEDSSRLGPRLFVTGPYLMSGDWTTDQATGAATPEEGAAVVARLADAGVDGIKVHAGVDAPTLRAVVEAAHARGLWVAAHLGQVGAAEASEIGVDTIEHASGIPFDDEAAPAGATLESARGANEAAQQAAIAEMVSHGVSLAPTLVVAEHAFTIVELARSDNPVLAFVPRFVRGFWIRSQIANAAAGLLTPEEIERRRQRLRELQRFVVRFHEAGGRVLAGTDAPAYLVAPGFDLHRELELLVESGLPPEAALAAATSEAAAALGHGDELGGLAPGMAADLVVVSGDPLSSEPGISATRNIVMVVKKGRVLVDRLPH